MVQSVLERENMSASDYGRGLIVQDLIKQGLLNLDDLTRICIMGLLPAVTNGVIQEKLQTRLPIT
jgi:hypothetical protein